MNIINMIQSFESGSIVMVVSNSSGPYENVINIWKFFLGRSIFLYLFMNLIKAILVYNRAKCLPMHVLAPPLNPPTRKGGKSLH